MGKINHVEKNKIVERRKFRCEEAVESSDVPCDTLRLSYSPQNTITSHSSNGGRNPVTSFLAAPLDRGLKRGSRSVMKGDAKVVQICSEKDASRDKGRKANGVQPHPFSPLHLAEDSKEGREV